MMKSFLKLLVGACLLTLLQAQADTYPSKLIRIVEPAGPGSAVDTAARDLTQGLSDLLGQQVIIDNKPGANSAIGANEVARSPADGSTLLHGNVNNALNDLLQKNNLSFVLL